MTILHSQTDLYPWKGFSHGLMICHPCQKSLLWTPILITLLCLAKLHHLIYKPTSPVSLWKIFLLLLVAIFSNLLSDQFCCWFEGSVKTQTQGSFSDSYRQIEVNDYYRQNYCDQLCTKQETRECNVQTCPINCVLGDYGPWSDCDPCIEKQVCELQAYPDSLNHTWVPVTISYLSILYASWHFWKQKERLRNSVFM